MIEQNGRTLAFLGDAAWSLVVRNALIEEGNTKGKDLQKKSIQYVSAKAQCKYYEALHEIAFFTETEEEWFRRGRNAKGGVVPTHTNPQTYRISTGFEAILGGLYLEKNWKRIEEIWDKVKEI